MRCPACGSQNSGAAVTVEDHEYRTPHKASYTSCKDCGTSYQTPMPSVSALAAFYPADYHSRVRKGLLGSVRNRLRLRRLKNLPAGDGVVLDYGCGDGDFLREAAKAMPGVKFFGYEIAPSHVIKKLNSGAVTIIEGSFEDLLKSLPPCRFIAMNHVIEHLPDPSAVLKPLHERLVPGGIFEGQTPAAGSFEQKIFGAAWSGYHAPRHTVIFSPKGLRIFLKNTGFDGIKIEPAFNPASLAVSLASSAQKPGSASKIKREGLVWLFWLGLACVLAPADLLSGKQAIMNFYAVKRDKS